MNISKVFQSRVCTSHQFGTIHLKFILNWSKHNWYISLFHTQDKHNHWLFIDTQSFSPKCGNSKHDSISWSWCDTQHHKFIYCLFTKHERIWKVLKFQFSALRICLSRCDYSQQPSVFHPTDISRRKVIIRKNRIIQ